MPSPSNSLPPFVEPLFVPKALHDLPQWVCYQADKVPICAGTGTSKGFTRLEMGRPYNEAVAATWRLGLAGVGFVLHAKNHLIGIDLDHCRDPGTGEIEPWAWAILELAETYAEVSPSGTGIHMFATGDLNGVSAINHTPAQVEMYTSGHYLTITGQHIASTPREVNSAPLTLAALHARLAAFGATTGTAGASKAKSAPIPEALALPEAKALALLDEIEGLIRNNGIGREEWIGIVYGFFNASGRNDDVEDIVDRFTAKREDGVVNPDADRKSVWDERGTADKAGLTTLVRWLEKQGTPEATAMVDRVHQIQAKSVFPPVDSGDNSPGPGAEPKPLPVIVDWETAKKGRTRTIQPTIFPGLDRGLLSVIGGASGTLKSTYLMHAAVAIIAERPDIIGHRTIDYCGDVLVFANEDPEEIIDKRLDAIMARHGVTSLKHKLYVQSGQMFEKTGRNGTFNWKPEAWAKIEAVILQTKAAKRQLALVAVDTLASTAAGNDETNREMQEIAGLMDDLVKQTFCAGLFVHHWRKSGPSDKSETDPQQDALRGGGALGNTVRNVIFVSKPNKADIEDASWTPDVARDFIKLWLEKRSYGPTTQDDPAWFEKEKVAVPVIDPRKGSLHMEDYLVLLPTSINKAKQREAVLIEAWRKIKAANAAGRELVQMGKANKSVRSVQGYLGLSDDKAEKLLADLVAREWVELVEGKGSDRRDAKHVVALEIEEDSNI